MTEPVHKLGEVLRAAREAKGIDLTRVERETKIRSRYLSALERGDYRDLPGSVYVRGFLRNYGLYLGQDPEYLIDLYRLETAQPAERPAPAAPPRPIAARRRRALVVTPGAVVASILTILVAALVIYTAYQFNTFARTPELRITDPIGDVPSLARLEYTIRGVTEPNAEIRVDGLRENRDITADADGTFEATIDLVPGSNVITLVAFDPVTRRESDPVSRTITVVMAAATASPPPALTVDQPLPEATLASPVAIAGHSAPGAAVEITASLIAVASLTFAAVDAAGQPVALQPQPPVVPTPASVTADADGAFRVELALAPGSWEVRVTPADGEGASAEPVTIRINVGSPTGLVGALRLEGGVSYLEVEQDGQPLAGVSGGISRDGDRVALSAERELRIRAGNAAVVRLMLNGVELGAMGDPAAVVEWRITPAGG
ncbi:MAG: RodZ domain-containing protein [Candidatus Limnocylindria bacterium]